MRGLLAVLAGLVIPTALAAQAPQPTDSAAERDAVLAVVQRLFDGMRQGDSAMVRSVFHPDARLLSTTVRDGTPEAQFEEIDGFVEAVGTPHEQVWDERISNTVVHLDGPLASVWTEYSFYAGDRFSHCGVDAFHLVRTPSGWLITDLADTRRREGCSPEAE